MLYKSESFDEGCFASGIVLESTAFNAWNLKDEIVLLGFD